MASLVGKAEKVRDELMQFAFSEMELEEFGTDDELACMKEVKYFFLAFQEGWLTIWELNEKECSEEKVPGDVFIDAPVSVEELMPLLMSFMEENGPQC